MGTYEAPSRRSGSRRAASGSTPRRRGPTTPRTASWPARRWPRSPRLLDDLPPGQRRVVVLRDFEGLSSADVCALLEISEANQRVLLHRGRSRIRNMLEPELGEA